MKPKTSLNRRRFITALAGCGAMGLAGIGARCSPAEETGDPPAQPGRGPAQVVRIERPSLVSPEDRPLQPDEAEALMGDLMQGLAGVEEPSRYLQKLFPPDSRIGIKVNCLAGKHLSPRPVLVSALIHSLEAAGVAPDRIIIFERTERELEKAGFPINQGPGVRVLGNDSRGAGYDREPTCFGSIGSCFSRILTEKIDGLINFGVLKDHDLAGVSVGLKNLFGLIHNPNKYHDNNCSPYVAHVAAAAPVKNKLKLSICDGLTAQYLGGPAYNPSHTWNAGLVLASTDTVALDAVSAAIIEAKRKTVGLEGLEASGQSPLFLAEAHRLGLGENRLEKIEIIHIA